MSKLTIIEICQSSWKFYSFRAETVRIDVDGAHLVLVSRIGVTPPALALWDVDGDSVEDVFLGVTTRTNDTHAAQGNKSKLFEKFWPRRTY